MSLRLGVSLHGEGPRLAALCRVKPGNAKQYSVHPNSNTTNHSQQTTTNIAKPINMSRSESIEKAQNYLARVRYCNELRAPQCPPKMLAMPSSALDKLCDANYTSTLARTDSINVEVDVELGMPLDMSHLPGVFDGDNSGGWFAVLFKLHSMPWI